MYSNGKSKPSDVPEYCLIEDVESLWRYTSGGYHPVMIGDVLHKRYEVLDKLGYGGWSTTWLVRDTQLERNVALKIGISDSSRHETAILRALAAVDDTSEGSKLIAVPLDEFEIEGPNGTHPCYTMAVAEGNLGDASLHDLFPLEALRCLAAGLTLAVAHVHSRGFVHGDIHLRNVLVKMTPEFEKLSVEDLRDQYGDPETEEITRRDGLPLPPNVPALAVTPLPLSDQAPDFTLHNTRVILSDFGEAFSPANTPRLGQDCHTPLPNRPPEAYFEPNVPLSFASDIWSLGCTIWNLFAVKALIPADYRSETEVGGSYIDVSGPIPKTWWENWPKRYQEFDANQTRINPDSGFWSSIDHAFQDGVQKFRRERGVQFGDEEGAAVLELMRSIMALRPEDRPTAGDILKSEWMVKWALPEYERAKKLWEESEYVEGQPRSQTVTPDPVPEEQLLVMKS